MPWICLNQQNTLLEINMLFFIALLKTRKLSNLHITWSLKCIALLMSFTRKTLKEKSFDNFKCMYIFLNVEIKLLRGESLVAFCTQCVIMTLARGGGGWWRKWVVVVSLLLITFWNWEKLSNFKAHELSWALSELCT